jgi:carboxyl-terminal processing protease
MKLRSSVVALLLGGFIILAFYPKVDEQEREGLILHALLSVMNQMHFQPQEMDDEFSDNLFDTYLSYVDGNKRFLTKEDIAQLEQYRTLLDDQAKVRSLDFFNLSVGIVESAMKRAELIYDELIEAPYDFTTEQEFELNREKRTYAENDAALKEFWAKILKYEMLSKIDQKLEEQNEEADELEEKEESMKLSISEIEAEAREEVKELFDDWFKRLNRIRRSDRFEAYLNSFTHLYDPHSVYYNPKEKQDFDMHIGGKLEGIGARLQTDGDYTKVVSIVPGGPAWTGKELQVDDLIMKVTQKGEEPVDVAGMRIDDVVQLIRGKKGTVVILQVKNKEGVISDIEIERDEVVLEEVFARSVIIDKVGEIENVGYIKLPKFYSAFGDAKGTSCSSDIAKEIEKLKTKNVNGIILDLRYNGGGVLNEVVQMSGLFIKDGPIVQVKTRTRNPYVYEDDDPGVKYTGPLIVMVNSYSASASEILAAALQDYGRAVIVGSNSTYGKGTVQRFFPLDRFIRGGDEFKPLGEVTMTVQKYYRVNGGSTQLKGVTPDIILPDNHSFLDYGEKEYDNALSWTQIDPVEYSQDIVALDNLELLKQNSEKRISVDKSFQLIKENAQRIKRNREQTIIPLSLEGYQSYMDKREEESKKYKGLMKEVIDGINISNLQADIGYIESDSSRIARNDSWKESLSKDIYIEETLMIMKDLIESDFSGSEYFVNRKDN